MTLTAETFPMENVFNVVIVPTLKIVYVLKLIPTVLISIILQDNAINAIQVIAQAPIK